MKKTIIALLALTGITCAAAEEITLLYGMDFNTNVPGTGVTYENIATNPGSGSIVTSGTGYHNYTTGMDGSSASDIRGAGYYFSITQAAESTNGLGVNTEDGFTIAFNTSFVSNDDWSSFFEINIGGQDLSFQWGPYAPTSINLFTKDAGGAAGTENGKLSVGSIAANTWYNVALVAKDNTLTLSVFNSSSELVGTSTVTAAYTGNLNSVTSYTSYKFSRTFMDNVVIYDGALTKEQLADLTTYEMTNKTVMQAIPEPTTATLSQLALAGLAARRRRK